MTTIILAMLGLFSFFSCTNINPQNTPNVNDESDTSADALSKISAILEKREEDETNEILERIALIKGEWVVGEFITHGRGGAGTDKEEKGREARGLQLTIDDEYNVCLDGIQYDFDAIWVRDYKEFCAHSSLNPYQGRFMGEKNIIDFDFLVSEDGCYAQFGLYLSEDNILYFFGGEWFNQRGMYELTLATPSI